MTESTATAGGEVVEPADLARRIRAGESLTVLDVRDRDEFDAWHVTGKSVEAVQIPAQQFVAAGVTGTTAELVAALADPIVAVCGRGAATEQIAGQLREAGRDAVNLAGGMAAWADVALTVDIPVDGATVRQYQRPATGCLSYLVVTDGGDASAGDDAARRGAVVVDPLRAFADRYVEDAADLGADIVAAVDTHVQADHVSGVRVVAEATGAEAILPAGAADRGLDRDREVRFVADGDRVAVAARDWDRDSDRDSRHDLALEAMHVPGHTSEMTVFRLADPGDRGDLLLGGDLLFLESVARPDLEAGAEGAREMARQLHRTLHERVLALPGETRTAPGHHSERAEPDETGAYVATLDDLRGRLALLDLDEDAFVDRVTDSMPPQPANFEVIIDVNLGRRSADGLDEETDLEELELGPNNCTAG